jgi:hypothetical protein
MYVSEIKILSGIVYENTWSQIENKKGWWST